MPSNSKLYVAIPSGVFRNFICGTPGSFHDCYILQSRSINNAFETFDMSYIRMVVHESDVTDELENDKTTTRVEMNHNVKN